MEYQIRKDENIEFYISTAEDEKSGGTRYTLRRSHGACWLEHVRGEELLSAVDDGNGVKLSEKLKSLNYAEFTELLLLLTFIKNHDNRLSPDYVIETVEKIGEL